MLYHYIMEKRKNAADVAGNDVEVKKEESKFTKLMRVKRNLSICFNFVYIIAYMAFTVFTFAGDNAEITWLPYVFAGFILVYAVLFICELAIAKNDRRKQNTVKDYKSGLKIVKKLLKLVNLILAIALVVNAVSGDRNIFSLVLSCVSVLYVIYQIIAEIRKMIKRRKKLKIKEKKDDCDKRFIEDVKQIWKGEEKAESSAEGGAENVAAVQTEQNLALAENCDDGKISGEVAASGQTEAKDNDKASAPAVKKNSVKSGLSKISKAANEKLEKAKKSAQELKNTAEKAKKITARAKDYYSERKQIDEEASGKKKKAVKKTDATSEKDGKNK